MGNYVMIDKEKVPFEVADLQLVSLKFYSLNPRVFTVLKENNVTEQEDIEECMCKLAHIGDLKLSIEEHGGLIDALIVKQDEDGDYIVLEGNSRLAAYRLLAKKDPVKWGLVHCHILPPDLSDEKIFQLLGQYHVKGKTQWSPYEQANFLTRQIEVTRKTPAIIGKTLGIKGPTAQNMVDTFKFMVDNGDANEHHWSYYFEYIKSPQIKQYRNAVEAIDIEIVKQIKNGDIKDAQDIRKLSSIIKLATKPSKAVLKDITEGKITLPVGYDKLNVRGAFDDAIKKLRNIRTTLGDSDFVGQCVNHNNSGEIKFELDKIEKQVKNIRQYLNAR